MTTSDELLAALRQAGDGVGEALTGANAAKEKAEEIIDQMTASGVQDKVAEFSAVKAAIEELITSLSASGDKVDEVIAQAQAASG